MNHFVMYGRAIAASAGERVAISGRRLPFHSNISGFCPMRRLNGSKAVPRRAAVSARRADPAFSGGPWASHVLQSLREPSTPPRHFALFGISTWRMRATITRLKVQRLMCTWGPGRTDFSAHVSAAEFRSRCPVRQRKSPPAIAINAGGFPGTTPPRSMHVRQKSSGRTGQHWLSTKRPPAASVGFAKVADQVCGFALLMAHSRSRRALWSGRPAGGCPGTSSFPARETITQSTMGCRKPNAGRRIAILNGSQVMSCIRTALGSRSVWITWRRE